MMAQRAFSSHLPGGVMEEQHSRAARRSQSAVRPDQDGPQEGGGARHRVGWYALPPFMIKGGRRAGRAVVGQGASKMEPAAIPEPAGFSHLSYGGADPPSASPLGPDRRETE